MPTKALGPPNKRKETSRLQHLDMQGEHRHPATMEGRAEIWECLSVPKDSGVVSSNCRPSVLACTLFKIDSCSEEV